MDNEPTDEELSDLLALMPSPPVEKLYEAAIFFDNDTNNFYEPKKGVCEVCPNDDKMRCIPINETENIQKCKWDEEPLKSYIKQFGNENIYLNALRILYDSDKFDVVSGIQDYEISTLNDWIEETESLGDRRAAIFDWDRTLTMFEGLVLGRGSVRKLLETFIKMTPLKSKKHDSLQDFTKEITSEDILLYLLGGEERLAKIREIFQNCYTNQISIYILTNNGLAKDNDSYREILAKLFDGIPYTLIWSGDGQGKGIHLKKIAKFKKICGIVSDTAGGKRKTKKLNRGTKSIRRSSTKSKRRRGTSKRRRSKSTNNKRSKSRRGTSKRRRSIRT
jgi:hypothetical protein